MVAYTNFYETLEEAIMRLKHTVITYDGEPFMVLAITNHRGDGIFRIYMEPCGLPSDDVSFNIRGCPSNQFPHNDNRLGPEMDKWLEKNPKSPIQRKMMNSPLFNKFRPFPLGMCNFNGDVYYLERQPNRKTEQGLISTMCSATRLQPNEQDMRRSNWSELTRAEFRDTVMGIYPTAHECVTGVSGPNLAIKSAAFHRHFALVRGPISTTFLAYKENIIGLLPDNNLDRVCIAKPFAHVKEAVQDLGIFASTAIR